MSSANSYPRCEVELVSSRLLLLFSILLISLAAAAPWIAAVPAEIAAPLSLMVVFPGWPLFRWARGSVRRIVLHADGRWFLEEGKACAHEARHLLPGTFVGSGLLLLHWRCDRCRRHLRAAVLHDNCDADAFRRLRVRLRLAPDENLFGGKRPKRR